MLFLKIGIQIFCVSLFTAQIDEFHFFEKS